MFIRIQDPFNDQVWFTAIIDPKTDGIVYWKAKDLFFETRGKVIDKIRRYFDTNIHFKRYCDITNCQHQTIVLSSEQVLELYTYLSDVDEYNSLEYTIKWFKCIHTGEVKLIPINEEQFFNRLNNVLGFNTISKRKRNLETRKPLDIRTYSPCVDSVADAENAFTLQQLCEGLCPTTLKKVVVSDQVTTNHLEHSFGYILSMMKDQ